MDSNMVLTGNHVHDVWKEERRLNKMNRFSITFDDENLAKLDKIGKKLDRNRSDTLRQLVKEYRL